MASAKRRSPSKTAPRTASKKETGLRQGLATYGDAGFSLFLRKAFIKAGGYSDDALDRPIVGITNTFSDYNPCHGNVPDLIEAVKRGVMLAGALPMVFPTVSIHESFSHPTSMFLRNLMSMDTEEMIRADGVFDFEPQVSIQPFSSGGTIWLVSCPPSQGYISVRITRCPREAAARAAATPPVPPPTTRTDVCISRMAANSFCSHFYRFRYRNWGEW